MRISLLYISMISTLCVLSFSVNAQDMALIDSIQQRKEEDLKPLDEVRANLDIAYQYLRYNLDSAHSYISEALADHSVVEALPDTFFRHHLLKAWYHQGSYNLDSSKYYYELAIDKAKLKKERSKYIQLLLNYSSILVDSKDEKAFQFLDIVEQAIDTSYNKNHQIIWNLTYQLRSRAYENKGQYRDAISTLLYITRATFFKDLDQYRYGVYNSLGIYLQEIGDYNLSQEYLKSALKHEELSDSEIKMLLANLIEVYIDADKLDSARVTIQKYNRLGSLEEAECQRIYYLTSKVDYLNGNYSVGRANYNTAASCLERIQDRERTLYMDLLDAEYAIIEKDQETLRKALKRIERLRAESPSQFNHDVRSKLSELSLKYELLSIRPSLIRGVDSLLLYNKSKYGASTDRQLKEMSAKYEDEKKEASIARLKSERNLLSKVVRNKNIALILTGLLGLSAFVIMLILRRSNRIEKERNQLIEDENEVLIFKIDELEAANTLLAQKLVDFKSTVSEEYSKVNFTKGTDIILVDPSTIRFIHSHRDGVKVFVMDDDKPMFFSDTLKHTLSQLPSDLFMQIKRNTIVNISQLIKINHNSVTLVDQTVLSVGGRYKQNVKDLKETLNSP